MAVSANSNELNDEYLNASLGMNTLASLKQKVGITISCKSLPNIDRRSKTDPFCVLWDISQSGKRTRVGQTEMIADNLNP